MSSKNDQELKDLCISLMQNDKQTTVIQLLKKRGFWDDPKVWRYYGDRSSNMNTIGNQQSRPDAAVVEKLVNSVDARLINECLLNGINPEGPEAPKSIRKAVALFFENGSTSSNAGLIREWPATKRTEVALGITLSATGYTPRKGNPCFTIADSGEGQTPLNLPLTILSLDRENKVKIPFVQGKYNMGGTGVLEFCGENNLQFVLSRRNPKLLDSHSHNTDKNWGFSIVRREDPIGNRRNSVYTYLAPVGADSSPHKGAVLSFKSETMPIFPYERDPYAKNAEWGTLIKLYEYSTAGFSGTNILLSSGLMRQLDLLLTDLALPIRLYECRSEYSGHEGSFSTNLTGIGVRLDDNKHENLEDDPYSVTMNVAGEKMTANIFVFKKDKADTYRSNEGIIFSVNGQTHGYLSTSFFRRKKVGMSYLSDSILVTIDCSNISPRSREILFMPSRDRLRDSELKLKIEKELEEILRNHQGLKKLREKRRREEIESMLNEEKPLGDLLEDLIKDSPTLTALFLKGKRLSNPFDLTAANEKTDEPNVRRFPTYFKFEDLDYGNELKRNCHINKRARITFRTDAENNYFSREAHRGKFTLSLVDSQGKREVEYTLNLWNEVATLNLPLPPKVQVGDQLTFIAITNDDTQLKPFINQFKLTIIKPGTKGGGGGNRRQPHKESDGDNRELPSGIQLPNIIKVSRNPEHNHKTWDEMSPPFDEYSALRIKHAASYEADEETGQESKDIYDFYVNVDNFYLKHELKSGGVDADVLNAKYVYAQVLLGLSVINYDNQNNEAIHEENSFIEDKIESFSIAISPVLLPIINELGGLELSE